MKVVALSAVAALACLLAFGCGAADDGDDSTVVDGTPRESDQAITSAPLCEDLVLHQKAKKFCDLAIVTCFRTCVLERHVKVPPPISGDLCEGGETTCEPWDCPVCPPPDDGSGGGLVGIVPAP